MRSQENVHSSREATLREPVWLHALNVEDGLIVAR
jgi:hypothetical protein